MTTAIQIDAETERLARKLAQAKGKALADVVREAIETSARAAGLASAAQETGGRDQKLAKLRRIADRSAARPILDRRSPDEIIGYDERGLPR